MIVIHFVLFCVGNVLLCLKNVLLSVENNVTGIVFQGTPIHILDCKQFIPHCDKNLIPVLHMTFDSLEEGGDSMKYMLRLVVLILDRGLRKSIKALLRLNIICVINKG